MNIDAAVLLILSSLHAIFSYAQSYLVGKGALIFGAFVHIAARQEDVSSVAFDQKEIRSHLVRCLTKRAFTFP